MKIIKDRVPDVTVIPRDKLNFFTIESMQVFNEMEDRVILRCAEYVEEFKRGLVCDLVINFEVYDQEATNKKIENDVVSGVVLVYVNKCFEIDGNPQYDYVFFK